MVLLALLVTMVIFRKDIALFIDIDTCLDSGNGWDHKTNTCIYPDKDYCLKHADLRYWDAFMQRCYYLKPGEQPPP